jgi:hypothetical protein
MEHTSLTKVSGYLPGDKAPTETMQPPGTYLPLAEYDVEKGRWVPSGSGDSLLSKAYDEFVKRQGDKEHVWPAVDPNGIAQHEPGAKLDHGKPDLSLLIGFGRALSKVGEVSTYGAAKYTRNGWESVPEGFERYTAAGLRHILAEGSEATDPESGLLHAAHHAWNALARLELLLRSFEKNGILTTCQETTKG